MHFASHPVTRYLQWKCTLKFLVSISVWSFSILGLIWYCLSWILHIQVRAPSILSIPGAAQDNLPGWQMHMPCWLSRLVPRLRSPSSTWGPTFSVGIRCIEYENQSWSGGEKDFLQGSGLCKCGTRMLQFKDDRLLSSLKVYLVERGLVRPSNGSSTCKEVHSPLCLAGPDIASALKKRIVDTCLLQMSSQF